MTPEELNKRVNFKTSAECSTIKEAIRATIVIIDESIPDGREKSLAMTKLEEALMWATAAVARNSGQ
jgi:hypothetical protein